MLWSRQFIYILKFLIFLCRQVILIVLKFLFLHWIRSRLELLLMHFLWPFILLNIFGEDNFTILCHLMLNFLRVAFKREFRSTLRRLVIVGMIYAFLRILMLLKSSLMISIYFLRRPSLWMIFDIFITLLILIWIDILLMIFNFILVLNFLFVLYLILVILETFVNLIFWHLIWLWCWLNNF